MKSISERRGWGEQEGISVVQIKSEVSDSGRGRMRIIRLIRRCTKGRTDASACTSGRNQQLVFSPQVNIPGSVPAALDGKEGQKLPLVVGSEQFGQQDGFSLCFPLFVGAGLSPVRQRVLSSGSPTCNAPPPSAASAGSEESPGGNGARKPNSAACSRSFCTTEGEFRRKISKREQQN